MLKVKFHTPTQYGSRQFAPGVVYELERHELPPREDRYEVVGKTKEVVKPAPKAKPVKQPTKTQAKVMKPKQVHNTAMVEPEVETKSDETVQAEVEAPQEPTTESVQAEE